MEKSLHVTTQSDALLRLRGHFRWLNHIMDYTETSINETSLSRKPVYMTKSFLLPKVLLFRGSIVYIYISILTCIQAKVTVSYVTGNWISRCSVCWVMSLSLDQYWRIIPLKRLSWNSPIFSSCSKNCTTECLLSLIFLLQRRKPEIKRYAVEPLNADTSQIWTLSCVPIVAILYKTTPELT